MSESILCIQTQMLEVFYYEGARLLLLRKVALRSRVTALRPGAWFSSLISTPESKLVSRLSTGLRRLCCSDTAYRISAAGLPSSDTNQARGGWVEGLLESSAKARTECLPPPLILFNVPGTDADSVRQKCALEALAGVSDRLPSRTPSWSSFSAAWFWVADGPSGGVCVTPPWLCGSAADPTRGRVADLLHWGCSSKWKNAGAGKMATSSPSAGSFFSVIRLQK